MIKDSLQRTILLAVLGSITLMPLLVLPVMVGSFVDYLGLNESEAGYLASAGFLGSAVAAIFVSLRVHHLDLRRLAYMGLVLMIVADSASGAAVHIPFWVLVGLRFVSGVGGAAAYASVMSAYAGWREPDRAYGLFMSFQFFFSAAGLYGLPWLLPGSGISSLFALFALLDVMALLLVSRLPAMHERSGAGTGAPLEWRVIVAATSVMCLFGIGLFEAANMANFTYSERIGLSFGLSSREIGVVLGASTVLGIPAAFGVFLLGSRCGRFVPIMAAALSQVTALSLLLTGSNHVIYVMAMCLLAMGWAFALPYFQAIEAEIDPGGSVVVAGGFATAFGGFAGPALAASLVSPGSYRTMIFAAMGAYFLVVILMRLVTTRMTGFQ